MNRRSEKPLQSKQHDSHQQDQKQGRNQIETKHGSDQPVDPFVAPVGFQLRGGKDGIGMASVFPRHGNAALSIPIAPSREQPFASKTNDHGLDVEPWGVRPFRRESRQTERPNKALCFNYTKSHGERGLCWRKFVPIPKNNIMWDKIDSDTEQMIRFACLGGQAKRTFLFSC
jgi:hypothetical protein